MNLSVVWSHPPYSVLYKQHLKPPLKSCEKDLFSFPNKKSETKSFYKWLRWSWWTLPVLIYMKPPLLPGHREDLSASSLFGRVIPLILNNELWTEITRLGWDIENPCKTSELTFPLATAMMKPPDRICWDHQSLLVRELPWSFLGPLLLVVTDIQGLFIPVA